MKASRKQSSFRLYNVTWDSVWYHNHKKWIAFAWYVWFRIDQREEFEENRVCTQVWFQTLQSQMHVSVRDRSASHCGYLKKVLGGRITRICIKIVGAKACRVLPRCSLPRSRPRPMCMLIGPQSGMHNFKCNRRSWGRDQLILLRQRIRCLVCNIF